MVSMKFNDPEVEETVMVSSVAVEAVEVKEDTEGVVAFEAMAVDIVVEVEVVPAEAPTVDAVQMSPRKPTIASVVRGRRL
jgi:hypothetical protein